MYKWFALLLCLFFAGSVFCVDAAIPAFGAGTGRTDNLPASGLHRLDFHIQGTGCAVCLMRVEGKIKAAPGVIKAAISIFKPYSGMVIYDSKKTDLPRIMKSFAGEPAKFADVKDTAISKVPLVLIPVTRPGANHP